MEITGQRTVHLVGHGDVTLKARDHLGTGGEASVYGRDGYAVKLYTDPRKMKQDDMIEKVKLLAAELDQPYITSPRGLVLHKKNPVGYYMPQATGNFLTYLFAPQWCKENGWTTDNTMTLVARMREVMLYAHERAIVMCDPNELNWMVGRQSDGTPEPRALDVDAWQIDRWKGTVVAPSVCDWNAKGVFTSETDRYAMGIVFFQLFTGAHPYKGPMDKAYTPSPKAKKLRLPEVDPIPEFIYRMIDGVSVFDSGARMSKRAAKRFHDDVPSPFANWFQDVFLEGKREEPPSPFDTGTASAAPIVLKVVKTVQGDTLRYERLLDGTGDSAVKVFPCGVVVRKSGALYDLNNKQKVGAVRSYRCEIVQVGEYWLVADWDGETCLFTAIHRNTHQVSMLKAPCVAKQYVRSEGRVFAANENGLQELELLVVGQTLLLGNKTNWPAMPNARWFDGIGVTDVIGKTFVNLPHGEEAYVQLRVEELDGLKPVAAKAGNCYAVIIAADPKGEYRKIELTFADGDYRSPKVWMGSVEGPELNMAMLNKKSLTLSVQEDGVLVAYQTAKGKATRFEDSNVTTDMNLGNWGNKVVFTRDGSVWSLSTS